MGDPLSKEVLASFDDELQKIAQGELLRRIGHAVFSKGVKAPLKMGLRAFGGAGQKARSGFGGLGELGSRLEHPIEGLRTGWREASPLPALGRRAKEMGFDSPQAAAEALAGEPAKLKALLGGGGQHLLGTAPSAGRTRAVFEGLSRRGWTGSGAITKYLPVGNKGLVTGFVGMDIPSIVNANKPSRTGEGGALERGMGSAGLAAGTLLGMGGRIGLVPATAVMMGAHSVGSRIGRVLDRFRAGAGVRDAVSAPSPEEAAKQFENIQRYYG